MIAGCSGEATSEIKDRACRGIRVRRKPGGLGPRLRVTCIGGAVPVHRSKCI
nr:MAG TPA: hypothetical protein [Caudoviricetes sp.]